MIRDVGNGRFNRVNITSGQQGFQPQPGFLMPQPVPSPTLIQNVGNGVGNRVNIR